MEESRYEENPWCFPLFYEFYSIILEYSFLDFIRRY